MRCGYRIGAWDPRDARGVPVPAGSCRQRDSANIDRLATTKHNAEHFRGRAVAGRRRIIASIRRRTCVQSGEWRREWDSNPRWYRYHAGFQDRCLKPLGHLSVVWVCRSLGLTGSPILRRAPAQRHPACAVKTGALNCSAISPDLVVAYPQRERPARRGSGAQLYYKATLVADCGIVGSALSGKTISRERS